MLVSSIGKINVAKIKTINNTDKKIVLNNEKIATVQTNAKLSTSKLNLMA